ETIVENFKPNRIATPSVPFRSSVYRRLLASRTVTQLRPCDTINSWQVLYPQPEDNFPQADDKALVLRGQLGCTRVLLLPDLGRLGQNALLQRNLDLRSEIVIASIPHAAEPLSDALLDRVEARVIIMVDAIR